MAAARAKVDPTALYSLEEAMGLVKETNVAIMYLDHLIGIKELRLKICVSAIVSCCYWVINGRSMFLARSRICGLAILIGTLFSSSSFDRAAAGGRHVLPLRDGGRTVRAVRGSGPSPSSRRALGPPVDTRCGAAARRRVVARAHAAAAGHPRSEAVARADRRGT